ncbi:hypothetical protein CWATWH0005_4144 [Crocosphaera watsonii WH 0005]|uniref:Uncharacterized protein n=1 Tax=Crocosphaera watsonii WH 0005 TaxID=423472 RepID=T2IS43_CROWT|nr:hypothetical protein CWATWH0005_4144 [Crocosphaera watsonii WH 0005]
MEVIGHSVTGKQSITKVGRQPNQHSINCNLTLISRQREAK